jgi:predicted Zn-dependent peptidase
MDRKTAPVVNNEVELTKLPVDKQNINGIEIQYVNGGSAPLLKLELVYNAGSKYQSDPLVASLGFDILKDGSKRLNGSAFKETINGLGVYYGFEISKDFGTLSFYVLERNLNELLQIIRDVISDPNLPKNEFERLRVKQKNDFLIDCEKTSFLARQKFAEVLFNACEYGNVAHAIDFDTVSFEMSVDFIRHYVVEAPFLFLVSGSISEQSKKSISSFAESLRISKSKEIKNISAPVPELGEHKIIKESEQCSVMLGKLLPSKTHLDIHKISITNTILGGYFGSRLMQNIREEKGWTYGIHSSILSYENVSSLVISADVLKDKGGATVEEIKKEIKTLQNELIPQEELDVLKNYLKGSLLKSFDGAFEQIDRFFSVDSFGLDWSYYDKYIDVLQQITPEEIRETASTYFVWTDFLIVKCGGATK